MTDLFAELATALRERIAAIADAESRQDPDAHMKRLQTISERINKIQAQLPRDVDPQLRHFLDRCSYDKALAFLVKYLPAR